MPQKIRQLLADLRKAGFEQIPGGKVSHRKWRHPATNITAIISGSEGDDAKPYQEREVRAAILESRESDTSPGDWERSLR